MFDDNRILTPFRPKEKAGEENLKYRCKPQTHLVSSPASKALTLGHNPRDLMFRDFVPGAVEHDVYALQHTLTDTDIRNEPPCVRQRLLQGAVQQLYINGQHVARIPKQLLQAAAKSGDSSDVIELPPDTDPRGVRMLIQHMLDIALVGGRPRRLRDNMNVYDSLAVCQAALVLGLTRYTSHVFRTLAMSLCSRIPSYEEMDAVLRFAGTHWRLWRDMVQRLSAAVRGEEIADVEGFAWFCFARPALNEALVETMQAQEAQVRVWAEEKQRRFVKEEERRKMWLVDRELERVQREQRVQRKKLDGQQRMEEKKRRAAHACAMRQACLVKTRASGRDRGMTIEEKKWFVKEFGKQPPRGC